MTDFSHEAARIVEAVTNAAYDLSHPEERLPTPFQRAVIGGLVLIADAAQSLVSSHYEARGAEVPPTEWVTPDMQSAAIRAIAPFLDETPVPNV